MSITKPRHLAAVACFGGICLFACVQGRGSLGQDVPPDAQQHERPSIQVDWRAQLAATQKQLETDPNSSFLHGQAAVAYNALGDFQSFDREIRVAMKLDPENPMPCYMAYAVYKQKHLKERQIPVLDAALKNDPNNPFGHYERAYILEDSKELRQALREYETVAKLIKQVKSEPSNFKHGRWQYTDSHGNPFDVSLQSSHIDKDIARVQTAIGDAERP
jgi:tetratricopeptide (TPR) repeat protein